MKIRMQEEEHFHGLSHKSWEIGFYGEPLDERGEEAIKFLKENTQASQELEYLPDDFSFSLNSEGFLSEKQFTTYAQSLKGKSIIIESTTLGLVEILILLKVLLANPGAEIDILYVEPGRYNNPRRLELLRQRDFELSTEVPGFKAVPGFLSMLSGANPQRVVFFLGYEEQRLERALEDHQMINSKDIEIVFGVPAFQPGWEMNSFANNLRVIREQNIRATPHFCGAENPLAAYEVLERIHKSLQENEPLFISPIGTKPTGIGAALFLSTHQNAFLLYDHPKRSSKRSAQVAKCHLYNVIN